MLDGYITPKYMPVKISEVFELAFDKYTKNYKTEYFFKNTIANKIFLKRHDKNSSTMITELRVGSNKADCVIINGQSVCYEIKTEFDSLKRLHEQVSTYSKVFEKVYVVCAKNHIKNVIDIVPSDVGIIELTENGALKELRKAKNIVNEIDRELMISSLRKPEYVYIAEKLTKKPLTSSNMHIFSDSLTIFQQASTSDLRKLYRVALKENRKNNFNLIDAMPPSLVNSAISFKLSTSQQEAFRNILSQYIYKDHICIAHL